MKTIKSLTKANANKYGFEVREDLNFEDDGNHFKGFSYKGLPLTQCTSKQYGTFLSIRVDYLRSECSFTHKEWSVTEEYRLADEFNGCSEIDVDKLIDNCERILAKIAELDAKTANEEVDITEVRCKMIDEISYASAVVERFKSEYKWYEADPYVLKNLAGYLKSQIKEIEVQKAKCNNLPELSRKAKQELVERYRDYGYVAIKSDSFYLRQMLEALN